MCFSELCSDISEKEATFFHQVALRWGEGDGASSGREGGWLLFTHISTVEDRKLLWQWHYGTEITAHRDSLRLTWFKCKKLKRRYHQTRNGVIRVAGGCIYFHRTYFIPCLTHTEFARWTFIFAYTFFFCVPVLEMNITALPSMFFTYQKPSALPSSFVCLPCCFFGEFNIPHVCLLLSGRTEWYNGST